MFMDTAGKNYARMMPGKSKKVNALEAEVKGEDIRTKLREGTIRLERALTFLCEYLDNQLKYNQRLIDLIFQEFIRIMPIDD